MFICENQYCQKLHDESFGSGRFCSRAGANSRGPMSDEDKQFRSQQAKHNPSGFVINPPKSGAGKNKVQRIQRTCKAPNCNNIFETTLSRNRLYCSPECWRQVSGGLRPKAGCGKKGWYKGFRCDSVYELVFLIYCLDHNIEIERNQEYWIYYDPKRNRSFKYYPDFRVDRQLTEIKGYKTYIDQLKIDCVNEPIKLLYRQDLNYAFQYVIQTYKVSEQNLILLYEDKQLFSHTCDFCYKEFESTSKNRTYCSRECSAAGNRRLSKKFQ